MTNETETIRLEEPPVQAAAPDKSGSPALKELIARLEKLSTGEEKVQSCLEFMQAALVYKAPRFKDYWEVKRICLPLFKDVQVPQSRSLLWSKYIEISTEARHLKDILDEQASFAMEQIDLAIKAVEADLQSYKESLANINQWTLPQDCQFLQSKKEVYETLQRELNLLNNFAARVNSLRKEVIRTEMRIRFKNKFFERLSLAGDAVFPRRKDLVKQISMSFTADIGEFSNYAASEEGQQQTPIFELREEIKALQQLAKELTLDTQTFNETRLQLSTSWDLLKEKDKERKKEMSEKQSAFKKNVDLILDKIKPFAERCLSPTITIEEATKQSNDILTFMKQVELGRDEVRFLKEEVSKAKLPVVERMRKEHEGREKELEEAQKQKRDKIEDFKKRLSAAQENIAEHSVEQLLLLKDELHKQLTLLPTTQAERELLEHALKEFRDHINDKKEKAIASLSLEERNSLEHLKLRLEDWNLQKQEIRKQLDVYRTALASSGFDFEKAMYYRGLFDTEKARLEKANTAIEEIEEKIEELENQ